MAADRALSPMTEFIARMKLGQGRPHVFPSELEGWSDYSNTARHKALVDAFGFLRAGPPREPGIPVSPALQEKLATYIRAHYPALVPPADFGQSANTARLWRRTHSP
jgi:hypothetical protein